MAPVKEMRVVLAWASEQIQIPKMRRIRRRRLLRLVRYLTEALTDYDIEL